MKHTDLSLVCRISRPSNMSSVTRFVTFPEGMWRVMLMTLVCHGSFVFLNLDRSETPLIGRGCFALGSGSGCLGVFGISFHFFTGLRLLNVTTLSDVWSHQISGGLLIKDPHPSKKAVMSSLGLLQSLDTVVFPSIRLRRDSYVIRVISAHWLCQPWPFLACCL
jgi:hypothetical protein